MKIAEMIVQIHHISQQTLARTIARKHFFVFHCFFHHPDNDQHIDCVYFTRVNYNAFIQFHEESHTAIKDIGLIALHPNSIIFQVSHNKI
jgi:hypothetical protein